MDQTQAQVVALADGSRGSREIAAVVGLSPRYVRRLMARLGCPRLTRGGQPGPRNHWWRGGRSVDFDGYATVPAPAGYPDARTVGRVLEHRLVLERHIGSALPPGAVVDHIDGLTLHNDPANLRIFQTNGAHLAATRGGLVPRWSEDGKKNIGQSRRPAEGRAPVDSFRERRERGDVRLRQILLAALKLGTGSPFLLGTLRFLEAAQIDPWSRPSLERALCDLHARWGWDRVP